MSKRLFLNQFAASQPVSMPPKREELIFVLWRDESRLCSALLPCERSWDASGGSDGVSLCNGLFWSPQRVRGGWEDGITSPRRARPPLRSHAGRFCRSLLLEGTGLCEAKGHGQTSWKIVWLWGGDCMGAFHFGKRKRLESGLIRPLPSGNVCFLPMQVEGCLHLLGITFVATDIHSQIKANHRKTAKGRTLQIRSPRSPKPMEDPSLPLSLLEHEKSALGWGETKNMRGCTCRHSTANILFHRMHADPLVLGPGRSSSHFLCALFGI